MKVLNIDLTDMIAMLVTSFVVLGLVMTWEIYLERQMQFPPILRPSILTKNHSKLAVAIAAYLCVCGYAGLIWAANIFYQRFEKLRPTQLMVRPSIQLSLPITDYRASACCPVSDAGLFL